MAGPLAKATTSKNILSEGTRMIPKNKFVSEINLAPGDYTSGFIEDATKIAESMMSPGEISKDAMTGVERMKKAFSSD